MDNLGKGGVGEDDVGVCGDGRDYGEKECL